MEDQRKNGCCVMNSADDLTGQESNELLCALIQQKHPGAREQLLQKNIGMIHTIAWRERKQYAYLSLELEDLWAAGQMGLLHAAERFSPSNGNTFLTYALMHVRQAIQRENMSAGTTAKIPVYLHDRLHKIIRYRDSFYNTDYHLLAKRVTAGELYGLGLTEKEVRVCLSRVEPMTAVRSLNEMVAQDSTMELEEVVCYADEVTSDELVTRRLMVSQCLECLDEREYQVIAMRYGLDGNPERTLVEIGEVLQVTKERVRQLEERALRKMRAKVESGDEN